MSKKLLKENTIRRFMKLASLGGLSSDFITENCEEVDELGEGMGDAYLAREEEDPLAGPTVTEPLGEEELPGEDLEAEEMPMDDLPMDDEPMDDEPMGEEVPEGDREELARKAIEAVAAALGIEVDISSEDHDHDEEGEDLELPAEEELPIEGEPEEDLGEAVEAVLEAAVEAVSEEKELEEVAEPVTEEEELTEAVIDLLNKADIEVVEDVALRESLVRKVAARVVKRLIKEQA